MYKEKFENILQDNEEIIQIERANKKTVFLKSLINSTICFVLFFLLCKFIIYIYIYIQLCIIYDY